jgi:hypothetical protein
VFKSVGSNWIITLVTVAAAYLLTPFTLHKLGDAGYGTWNLINSITGYLALLVLGVPMASVRYFAQHVADGDVRKLNQAIGSCTALYLMLGAMALVVGVGLYAFFNATYDIPAAMHGDARLAFALTVLYVAVGFVGMLPNGVLSAHDDFVPRNLVRLAGVVLRLGLTLGLLTLRPSLSVLAVPLAGRGGTVGASRGTGAGVGAVLLPPETTVRLATRRVGPGRGSPPAAPHLAASCGCEGARGGLDPDRAAVADLWRACRTAPGSGAHLVWAVLMFEAWGRHWRASV